MTPLIIALAACAGLSWLSAAVHWVMLLGHRRPEVSLGRLLLHGIAAFNRDNFQETGWPIQRRMGLSFLAFFISILAVAGAAAIASQR